MSSTPLYHPDDDETNPLSEDQGISHEGGSEDSADTDLDELSDEGVGGTLGAKDSFEPEESDGSRSAGRDDPSQM